MSKFTDSLKEVSRVMSRPIGFGRIAQVSPKPRLLLVAGLDETDNPEVAGQIVGADSLLLPAAGSAKQNSKSTKIPWGVFVRDYDAAKIKELKKNGGDYIVFPADSIPLRLLEDTKLGRIMVINGVLEDSLIKAVNGIAVDAVCLDSEKKEPAYLTWRRLILFRRLTALLTKPLIVPVPREISDEELIAVWEAGVVAVIVAAGTNEGPQLMKELCERVDKLTFPPQRRIDRGAVLPQMGDRVLHEEEVADEDEE